MIFVVVFVEPFKELQLLLHREESDEGNQDRVK